MDKQPPYLDKECNASTFRTALKKSDAVRAKVVLYYSSKATLHA
jgi:hypothetical protein